MKSVIKFFLGSLASACALVPSFTNADSVNYTIDTSLSHIQLDVLVDARPTVPTPIDATTPQFVGSDIAIPTGTISATRFGDLDGLIALTGSDFTYLNNPTPMAPATTNGTTEPAPQPPGSDPAVWGFNTNLFNGIVGPVALRDVHMSLTAGLQGMFGGAFDGTSVALNLLAAHNDQSYVGPGIPVFGVDPIDEWSGFALPTSSASNTALAGQLTMVGNVETLTLPISLSMTNTVGDVPVILQFNGVFVATRVVPEPGTIAIAALGMVGLVTCGYRARKRNA
jgi:hypothetical protein